jgi:hypothetical protein
MIYHFLEKKSPCKSSIINHRIITFIHYFLFSCVFLIARSLFLTNRNIHVLCHDFHSLLYSTLFLVTPNKNFTNSQNTNLNSHLYHFSRFFQIIHHHHSCIPQINQSTNPPPPTPPQKKERRRIELYIL